MRGPAVFWGCMASAVHTRSFTYTGSSNSLTALISFSFSMTLTLSEDQAGPHFIDRKDMHAWLGSRLVPQGPTQRFAIDGHMLLLLLPSLLSQTAGCVLTPLPSFPTRDTAGDHREQVLRVDFAKRIQIGPQTGHARTPQGQGVDDPAPGQSDPLGGGADLGRCTPPPRK